MARFVILNFRAGYSGLVAGALGLATCFSGSLQAQQTMTQAQGTPAKTPATNAAPVNPQAGTLGRYGKILAPGDEITHPLKLKMPFPGVGEVKIPSLDELNMREKLEQLAKLSDADIRTQLQQWPAFSKMSLRDEGAMLQRIQDFRDYRANVAKSKAHDMGLLTLLPDQQARFENEYWTMRLQMDRDLAKQFDPIFKAREQKMKDELFREFSSVAPGPIAQNKGKGPTSPPAMTNVVQPMQPIAQAPH